MADTTTRLKSVDVMNKLARFFLTIPSLLVLPRRPPIHLTDNTNLTSSSSSLQTIPSPHRGEVIIINPTDVAGRQQVNSEVSTVIGVTVYVNNFTRT